MGSSNFIRDTWFLGWRIIVFLSALLFVIITINRIDVKLLSPVTLMDAIIAGIVSTLVISVLFIVPVSLFAAALGKTVKMLLCGTYSPKEGLLSAFIVIVLTYFVAGLIVGAREHRWWKFPQSLGFDLKDAASCFSAYVVSLLVVSIIAGIGRKFIGRHWKTQ